MPLPPENVIVIAVLKLNSFLMNLYLHSPKHLKPKPNKTIKKEAA